MTPRPTVDEPLVEMNRNVSPSLISTLEKLLSETAKLSLNDESLNKEVPVGTPCKNSACQVVSLIFFFN